MNKKKNILEELEHYPEGIELNEDLVKRAQELTAELYGPHGKHSKRKNIFRIATAAVLSCCLVLCICLPLCFSNMNVPKTYLSTDLEKKSIANLPEFIAENALDVHYLSSNSLTIETNTAFYIRENNELAFIDQYIIYMETSEIVDLGICFSNDEFEEFIDFIDFTKEVSISNSEVNYKVQEVNNVTTIFGKFKYQNIIYYLQIQTGQSVEERLEYYVNLLLN